MRAIAWSSQPSSYSSHDDDSRKKNVLILSLAQALYGTCFTILVTLNSLVGHELAPSAALATLPMTALIIGTAIFTIPASS